MNNEINIEDMDIEYKTDSRGDKLPLSPYRIRGSRFSDEELTSAERRNYRMFRYDLKFLGALAFVFFIMFIIIIAAIGTMQSNNNGIYYNMMCKEQFGQEYVFQVGSALEPYSFCQSGNHVIPIHVKGYGEYATVEIIDFNK